MFVSEAAAAARFAGFRELVRVPPACSYNGESGPYAPRILLRKRVTNWFSSRTLSSRLALRPDRSTAWFADHARDQSPAQLVLNPSAVPFRCRAVRHVTELSGLCDQIGEISLRFGQQVEAAQPLPAQPFEGVLRPAVLAPSPADTSPLADKPAFCAYACIHPFARGMQCTARCYVLEFQPVTAQQIRGGPRKRRKLLCGWGF